MVAAGVIGVFAVARLYLAVDHPFDILLAVALVRRHPGQRLPVLHAQRGVPGDVPAGARRPISTSAGGGARRSATRCSDQLGLTVDGHQAGRAGGLRRFDATAADGGRRPRQVPVREALRDEPRPGRPLVQAGPHHPVRAARGRGAVPERAAPGRVRGLHGPGGATTPASRPPRRTGSSSSPRSGSTCSSPSSSTAPTRSARPTVDDAVIDEGLMIVRRLWDAGLAHRDIKPANLMVRDGRRDADRRRLRPGAPVAVAPGRRPGQHDAGPRACAPTPSACTSGPCSSSPPTRSPRPSPPPGASPARPSCGRR